MIMGARKTPLVPCWICGAEVHTDNCPYRKLERLEELQQEINCPKCKRGKVEVNATDYYECHRCHIQFSAGGLIDCDVPEKAELYDARSGQKISVVILKQRGAGHFSFSVSIAGLRHTIKALWRAKKRPFCTHYHATH